MKYETSPFSPGMLLLRVRFIVILSLVYLCLVLLLYSYLWKTRSLERGLSLLEFTHHSAPHDQDVYDLVGDAVMFNFRRRNGFLEDKNSTSMNASSSSEPTEVAINENDALIASPLVDGDSSNANTRSQAMFNVSTLPPPSKCIHAFYYMWYGNPEKDGKFYHWNHPYLPHWKPEVSKNYPLGRHLPPDDIGASFYPKLGCYSSRDPALIEAHMHQLRKAGVGVLSVSWYPAGKADDEGFPPDPLVPLLLDIAEMYSIQVTMHIEPYKGRTPGTVRNDLKYIQEKYSSHPAFYKQSRDGSSELLPLIYVYDSYINKARDWAEVLKPNMPNSIRGTALDCIVIGLLVERNHQQLILNGGFDGFYTYFASNGFSYGSSTRKWKEMAEFAKKNRLIFIPSFGPGYDDVRVRPWNKGTSKLRESGKYYRDMSAVAVRTRVGPGGQGTGVVSLTSFNEWHEGTQIEAAIPKATDSFTYADYRPDQPEFFLEVTWEIASGMQCSL